MKIKWLLILLPITYFLISIFPFVSIENQEVRAATRTINLEYELPDKGAVLINSPSQIGLVYSWILSGDQEYHTGWSGEILEYDTTQENIGPDGKMSHWFQRNKFSTQNSKLTYSPTLFKNEIIRDYGVEIYQAILSSGKRFTAKGDLSIEEYRIYEYDSRVGVKPKHGDVAFTYRENKVIASLSFSLTEDEIGGGTPPSTETACPQPDEVPLRYEHELDLAVNRIDARTVDINTVTNTDVYVSRGNFSSSRNQAKQEFNDYINDTKAKKTECESLIAQWEGEKTALETEKAALESEKANLQSALASCQSTVVAEGQTPPDCSVFNSHISEMDSLISEKVSEIEEKTTQINEGKAMLPIYDQKVALANTELNYISSNESRYSTVSTTVQLTYNGSPVSNLTVSLSEGDSKRYTFPSWKPNQQGKDIMAQINGNGPYQEFRYTNLTQRQAVSLGYNTSLGHLLYPNSSSNNWKNTTQYVSTYESNACPKYEENKYFETQSISAIVRTVNDNGTQRNYYETLTTSFTKLPREEMRAGYGFEYTITTNYKNNDTEPEPSQATGTKLVESYFPSMVNYQPYTRGGAIPKFDLYGNAVPVSGVDEGYRVYMNTSNPSVPRSEVRNWILPPVAVEEYSGNVFTMDNEDHLNHEKRNLNEKLLVTDEDGKSINKWFVDFTQPDGVYDFRIRTYDSGVNHLSTCHNGKVEIDGVITGDPDDNDDYVKRAVDSQIPFPSGIGWNWNGKVNQITELNTWYTNWESDPKALPINQYQKAFYLTPKIMQQINEYTSQHPKIILGESVLDQVNVPGTKE